MIDSTLKDMVKDTLPYDGEYVYYDGDKMTPQQSVKCIYAAFGIVFATTGLVILIRLLF